jgi:hypothetical protein
MYPTLPEYIEGLPNISGSEELVDKAAKQGAKKTLFKNESAIDFGKIKSACAIALHVHQPLIPAGGGDLRTAAIISNLKYMMDNQGIGDNHNAPVFVWCYKRIGDFIPQLVGEGKNPRVMLDYSGTLFHGMRAMGLNDVFDNLKRITLDANFRRCVEWLGCPWGHAVAPSTPVQDYRLHVKAWQQHFAAIFGLEALERVRGFSPAEMAIPNHPDLAFEFVKTLKECGFQWVLVQEHSVERPDDGQGMHYKHMPHRLVCTNSKGEKAEIIAIIKTQGSDTKLVAQMQPYYEEKSLSRVDLAGHSIPPLVTQIADGENGGVMMNEFPGKYIDVMRECAGSETPAMNASEYLEHLFSLGIKESDLPPVQPLMQKRIWDRMQPGDGPDKLSKVIEQLKKDDGRFHMEGGSWTNNISWVRGYDSVIGPMEKLSAQFYQKAIAPAVGKKSRQVAPSDHRFRNALFHLLASQTSCYRYWGQGIWMEYGKEICRRASEVLEHDFS